MNIHNHEQLIKEFFPVYKKALQLGMKDEAELIAFVFCLFQDDRIAETRQVLQSAFPGLVSRYSGMQIVLNRIRTSMAWAEADISYDDDGNLIVNGQKV